VKEGTVIPDRKVLVGNPAKIVKDVTDEMADWKTEGTKWYQRLPQQMRDTWQECEPLREIPADRDKDREKNEQSEDYKTWGERKK